MELITRICSRQILIVKHVFKAVFNSISVVSPRPVHLFMLSWSSFNQYSEQYSFQATAFRDNHWTEVREELILSGWLSSFLGKNVGRGSYQRAHILKSCTLPSELWGSPKADLACRLSNPFQTIPVFNYPGEEAF